MKLIDTVYTTVCIEDPLMLFRAVQTLCCYRVEFGRQVLHHRFLEYLLEDIDVCVNSQEPNKKTRGVLKHHLSNN